MAQTLIRSAPYLMFCAHALLDGGDAVGDAFGGGVVFGGQEVIVAMAAGDAQRRPAHLHVRTRNVAGVDIVAQGDIGIAGCADVAHAGESGLQRDLGEAHAVERLAHGVGREARVRIEIVAEGEVRMHVDQARQHGHGSQVDFAVARLGGRGRGGAMAAIRSPVTTIV